MSILISDHSRQGHTEKVALALATEIHGALQEIEPVGESGMLGKAMRAAFGMRAALIPAQPTYGRMTFLSSQLRSERRRRLPMSMSTLRGFPAQGKTVLGDR